MKTQRFILFSIIVSMMATCWGSDDQNSSKIGLNFDVLYPESMSTQVIRLARHVWADCIHMDSDNNEQNEERLVRHMMNFYLAFARLQESRSFYEPDMLYITDVFAMLARRYMSGFQDDPSMACVMVLFQRCCAKIAELTLALPSEAPESFEA